MHCHFKRSEESRNRTLKKHNNILLTNLLALALSLLGVSPAHAQLSSLSLHEDGFAIYDYIGG